MQDADVAIKVMNIERFATHDGPGIRTVAFLKGCPLRCPWCANPETQDVSAPVLFHDAAKCVGCRACEQACDQTGAAAIRLAGGVWSFDARSCTQCHACERACLHEALELQGSELTVEELLAVCERDRDYYEASDGGVTLSGGEPLMRLEPALAFFREAHRRGLTTGVETTGNVARTTLEAVEPHVDHFLYDLKHLDAQVLRDVAHGNRDLICENLRWLAAKAPEKINVRIPVIPGFNYDHDTLVAMIAWLHGVGVLRVNLLPYHTLGLVKYDKMGMGYQLPRAMLHDDDLAEYHEYALGLGMESKIGA